MDTRDLIFTCPDCGHQTAYRPEEYALFTRYRVVRNLARAFRIRLVYCAG
jgi:hypothetical protein